MNSVALLLHFVGAITLLVWAVRHVRTGVERAFGPELKRLISRAADSRTRIASVGTIAAVTMQSSTAVALLVSGFSASALISGSAGLALMLGADVGSALVVAFFTFDLSWLTPLLLVVGGLLFLKASSRRPKQVGRILMGIAFILVSLRMMGEATIPLRDSDVLPQVVQFLVDETPIVFVIGALFTWMIHSSVAAVLLFAALAAQGILPFQAAVPLVLGANLGSGLIALGLTRDTQSQGRRLPVGNMIFRGSGALIAMALLYYFPASLDVFGWGPATQVIALHVGFNIALALIGLPLTGSVAALVQRLLPDRNMSETLDHPLARRETALDQAALDTPRLALASASRELLHIGEVADALLIPAMEFFEEPNKVKMEALRRLDDIIDDAHRRVKMYLAEMNRRSLSDQESKRSMELIGHAINLEHIGDLISKELYGLAEKCHAKSVEFSPEGREELDKMHERVLTNLRLAMNVLVSGDIESARELVAEKKKMREIARDSHEAHLQRLQSGTRESVETSDIHLEAVRALKEINSLAAQFAYPLLVDRGELLESRLRNTD